MTQRTGESIHRLRPQTRCDVTKISTSTSVRVRNIFYIKLPLRHLVRLSAAAVVANCFPWLMPTLFFPSRCCLHVHCYCSKWPTTYTDSGRSGPKFEWCKRSSIKLYVITQLCEKLLFFVYIKVTLFWENFWLKYSVYHFMAGKSYCCHKSIDISCFSQWTFAPL